MRIIDGCPLNCREGGVALDGQSVYYSGLHWDRCFNAVDSGSLRRGIHRNGRRGRYRKGGGNGSGGRIHLSTGSSLLHCALPCLDRPCPRAATAKPARDSCDGSAYAYDHKKEDHTDPPVRLAAQIIITGRHLVERDANTRWWPLVAATAVVTCAAADTLLFKKM